MTRSNGESVEKTLTYDDKLDILITALAELTGLVDTLVEQNDELVEKLSNITASGPGFEVDDYDGN